MTDPDRQPRSVRVQEFRRRASLLVGERPGLIAGIVAVSVVAGVCESAILALIATIAGSLVAGHSKISLSLGPLHLHATAGKVLLTALAFALVRLAVQGPLSYLPARLSADVQASMRLRLFSAFHRAPWAVKSTDGEGRYQELSTDQVYQATNGVLNATSAITMAVMLAVLVCAALIVEFTTALFVIATGVVLFFLFRPLNRLARRQARALSVVQMDYAGSVHDAVNMAEEAQVFGVGPAEERQLERLVRRGRNQYFKTQFLQRFVPGAYQCIIFLLLIGGLAVLVATGDGHIDEAGAVILLLIRASSFGQGLQGSWVGMYQSLPFIEQITNAEKHYQVPPVIRGTVATGGVPDLRFDGVSYAYNEGRPVLRDVTFKLRAGEAIGLVGPTGAGKSTLTQVLLGLREPDSGEYVVGGVPAHSWSPEAWTKTFAYVPQEPRILQGSVAENIRFYRDVSDEEVVKAAQLAHIHDEIMAWPDGYATNISQRAKAVSGGQRQRLCLARALVGGPSVLVLDEPTSQLDPRSESLVQDSLTGIKGQLTLFIVAHRLSTLGLCDRVMVVRAGKLEAFAPAEELKRSNEFFRKAASLSQSGVLRASS